MLGLAVVLTLFTLLVCVLGVTDRDAIDEALGWNTLRPLRVVVGSATSVVKSSVVNPRPSPTPPLTTTPWARIAGTR